MNIYIDESGSINNSMKDNDHFIITLVQIVDKKSVERTYKLFVRKNMKALLELDKGKIGKNEKYNKAPNKMFKDGKFSELKGSQFDRDMKLKFIKYFGKSEFINVFYIIVKNKELTDNFCLNTARAFNYVLKIDLKYLIKHGILPNEDYLIQLDERNEKTESIHFLKEYLNTEFCADDYVKGKFEVIYYDSSCNKFIQIADVFSNIMFSNLKHSGYETELNVLRENKVIIHEFEFPMADKNS